MDADDRPRLFPTAEEEQISVDRFFFDNFYVTLDNTRTEAIEKAGMMVQIGELDQLKKNHCTDTGIPYHGVIRAVARFCSLTIVAC
jgi:hypothetical protein